MKSLSSKKSIIVGLTSTLVMGSALFAASSFAKQGVPDLSKVQISLQQAISAAQQQNSGTVIEAELENEDGQLVYDIELQQEDGSQVELQVNPLNGSVSPVVGKGHGKWGDDDKVDGDENISLTSLKFSLGEAIAQAESKTGGQAYEAELESDDGRLTYEVELVGANGNEIEFELDATKALSATN